MQFTLPYNLVYNLVSSTKFNILQRIDLSMSLMYIINNSGPNTDPCGTPLTTARQSDICPPSTTLCCLPFSQLSIHCNISPPITCDLNFRTVSDVIPYQKPSGNLDILHLLDSHYRYNL